MSDTELQRRNIVFFGAFSILAVATIYAFRAGTLLLADPDSMWHVRMGRDIIANGLLDKEIYSYTFKGAPYFQVEWLAEVVLGLAHMAGGWTGVALLAMAAIALTTGIAYAALSEAFKPLYAAVFAAMLMIICSSTLLARPHIISLPIFTLWTWRLFKAAQDRRAPEWWLLPLVTIWANMHAGYIIGFAVACFAFLDVAVETRLKDRALLLKWIGFGLAAGVCSLINPQGFGPALLALHLATANETITSIIEWQPFTFELPYPSSLAVPAVIALLLLARPKLTWTMSLFFLFTLYMYLSHRRFVLMPFLFAPLALAPRFAPQFDLISREAWNAAARDEVELAISSRFRPIMTVMAVVAALGLGYVIWSKPRQAQTIYPTDALAYAEAEGLEGPVLNSYDFGGALVFHGIPTFVDGRTDLLFLGQFWKDYQTSLTLDGENVFWTLIDKYKITWTLLPPKDERNWFLARKAGWRKAYADEHAIIYSKDN